MYCPHCDNEDTKVLDSRLIKKGRSVRRRRSCSNCGHRFTTFEQVEETVLYIEKKDGRREAFDIHKLQKSIQVACHKRNISIQRIEQLAFDIKSILTERAEQEVTASQIGDLVMDCLKKLDEVAYIRFASVYKEFQDKKEFVSELKKLS